MFRKVHIRLTLLFTGVCTLILSIMSVFYIFLNNRSIYDNAYIDFTNDVTAFCSSFSDVHIISHDWLRSIQKNYNYDFFIFDNDIPAKFTVDDKSEEELARIEDIKKTFSNEILQMKYSGIIQHKELIYYSSGKKYYVGMIRIPGQNGSSDIYILDMMINEKKQIKELHFHFIIIILITAAVLFAFSYFFTWKLLIPIKRSHEQQVHFIAAASHEIRNPVNTIISALDAMKKCSGRQHEEFASIARKEGKRLSILTEDLMTLARSDSGNFIPDLVHSELDTILLDCYEAFIALATEKKIQIKITLPEERLPSAYIDIERIKQMLSIILSNAVSYTPENGIIDISYTLDHKWHHICISNNGPKISDEDKQHIFERFYRADRSRKERSHFGLGLSIAKEIIDIHHGKILVVDNEYNGTAFIISLLRNESLK